jgi:hypothetical protein
VIKAELKQLRDNEKTLGIKNSELEKDVAHWKEKHEEMKRTVNPLVVGSNPTSGD